jgi:hypothetical protein
MSNVMFTNHYRCPCGHEWIDKWVHASNDRCPKCNKEIEPYKSDPGHGYGRKSDHVPGRPK